MCHLSPFGLLNIAQAGILSLGVLDVITREQDDVPSAHVDVLSAYGHYDDK